MTHVQAVALLLTTTGLAVISPPPPTTSTKTLADNPHMHRHLCVEMVLSCLFSSEISLFLLPFCDFIVQINPALYTILPFCSISISLYRVELSVRFSGRL